MAILDELVEFVASVTQLATSEGFKKLLPRSKSTETTVTYGSVKPVNEINCKNDDDHNVECIYEEYSTDDTSSNEPTVLNQNRPPLAQRLRGSIWTSFVITLLVGLFPLGVSATVLVYLNLNTSNLCFKWSNQLDKLPKGVMGLKFVADEFETMVINLWFPLTLCVLFRLTVFKVKYIKALAVCLVVGLLTVLFKSILFASGLYHRKPYYNFPSNILFNIGVLYGSYVVAEKIRKENPEVPIITCFVKLSIQFILGSIVCCALTYGIVPWFNDLHNEREKVVSAAFAPSTALIPKVISLYFAGKAVVELTNPERSFILAWYPHGVAIIVFRIMQSDLKRLEIFIGLCVFNGAANIIMRLTVKLRQDFWIFVLRILRTKVFSRRINSPVAPRSPHLEQRLNADISIQTMLCETTSLIICQAYFALYIITNFQVSLWPVLNDFIVRISVALAIDFIFNSLSIFILTNWHNVPVLRVWNKHWQIHIAVSFITIFMTIVYFSPVLLTVVQTYADNAPNLEAKNCSLPFI